MSENIQEESIVSFIKGILWTIVIFFIFMCFSWFGQNDHIKTEWERDNSILSSYERSQCEPYKTIDFISMDTIGGAFVLIGFVCFLMGCSIAFSGSDILSNYPNIRICLGIWAYFVLIVIVILGVMGAANNINKRFPKQ